MLIESNGHVSIKSDGAVVTQQKTVRKKPSILLCRKSMQACSLDRFHHLYTDLARLRRDWLGLWKPDSDPGSFPYTKKRIGIYYKLFCPSNSFFFSFFLIHFTSPSLPSSSHPLPQSFLNLPFSSPLSSVRPPWVSPNPGFVHPFPLRPDKADQPEEHIP